MSSFIKHWWLDDSRRAEKQERGKVHLNFNFPTISFLVHHNHPQKKQAEEQQKKNSTTAKVGEWSDFIFSAKNRPETQHSKEKKETLNWTTNEKKRAAASNKSLNHNKQQELHENWKKVKKKRKRNHKIQFLMAKRTNKETWNSFPSNLSGNIHSISAIVWALESPPHRQKLLQSSHPHTHPLKYTIESSRRVE